MTVYTCVDRDNCYNYIVYFSPKTLMARSDYYYYYTLIMYGIVTVLTQELEQKSKDNDKKSKIIVHRLMNKLINLNDTI